MKAYLLFPDRDLSSEPTPPWNAADLVQDLQLQPLVDAMAAGDRFLSEIAASVIIEPLTVIPEIHYRQDVLRDCQAQETIVREMYDLAVEAIERERKTYGWLSSTSPGQILRRSVEVLEIFVSLLRMLRTIAEEHGEDFQSAGFQRFFEMTKAELDDDYFGEIDRHLRRLRFKGGILMSASVAHAGKPTALVLRRPIQQKRSIGDRINEFIHPPLSFRIAERDEAGFNALSEYQDRGVNLVADALARSTDHILSFFKQLRSELGFYIGCLNAQHTLEARDLSIVFPQPVDAEPATLVGTGLYDISLALVSNGPISGNEVNAADKHLIVVTGANRGGKSTFLRSVGQAQVMMQAGMFVGGQGLTMSVAEGIATHFKREEDASMTSGKFDEELVRMHDIVEHVKPHSLMLFNESFAATNEREGSEIAHQVVTALLDAGIRVVFVTHQYTLAHAFAGDAGAYYLRAERERTFKLIEGEPLPTSFGDDLYQRIFGADPRRVAAGEAIPDRAA